MRTVEELFEELNDCHESEFFDDRKVEDIIRDDRTQIISEFFEKVAELLGRSLDGAPQADDALAELEILKEITISEACE
jgi:hypothetical protein